jgi:exosortase
MSTSAIEYRPPELTTRPDLAALAAAMIGFVVLYAGPMTNTARVWWSDPEAGHGLLLAPVAMYLAWRRGLDARSHPNPWLGLGVIAASVLVRWIAALAAEAFFARASMLGALVGIIIFFYGVRQLYAWWLPALLLALSLPLPEIVLGSLALPLQFEASRLGAALLSARGIPVLLDGNVIRLPGHDLFVTEACSGLRSLTALLSLGVLLGGILLRHPVSRVAIVLLAIPIGIVINGIRVFVTGFLVLFVNPKLAEGFSHMTEGWLMFLIALAMLGGISWIAMALERRFMRETADA